jgi:hypothetical protein
VDWVYDKVDGLPFPSTVGFILELFRPYNQVLSELLDDSLEWVQDRFKVPGPPPLPPPGSLLPPEFDKFPTRPMADEFRALGGPLDVNSNRHFCWLQRRRYVDHRQQWEAKQICLGNHPRIKYLETEGGRDYFSYWVFNRETWEWDLRVGSAGIQVTDDWWLDWPWGGAPPDTSDLTAGQYMITWATWAAYFRVYGIPSGEGWGGLSCSGKEVPCELGDHKDSSLDLTGFTGEPAGFTNPYGPDGCMRGQSLTFLATYSGSLRFDVYADSYFNHVVGTRPILFVSSVFITGTFDLFRSVSSDSYTSGALTFTTYDVSFPSITGGTGTIITGGSDDVADGRLSTRIDVYDLADSPPTLIGSHPYSVF